jgi:hypothetical protein
VVTHVVKPIFWVHLIPHGKGAGRADKEAAAKLRLRGRGGLSDRSVLAFQPVSALPSADYRPVSNASSGEQSDVGGRFAQELKC